MTKPAENPEKNQNKPAWCKIIYAIAMTVLVGLVLVCGWMYLQQYLPVEPAPDPTEGLVPTTAPAPTMAPSPIVTFPTMITESPSQTLSSMVIFFLMYVLS